MCLCKNATICCVRAKRLSVRGKLNMNHTLKLPTKTGLEKYRGKKRINSSII